MYGTFAIASLFAACKGSAPPPVHEQPDASQPQPPDALTREVDAFVAPPDAFIPCNYTEQHDATNDYNLATGYQIEATALVVGSGAWRICGTVNNGHFDTNFYSVDIDNYSIAVAADADVLVTLAGAGQNVSSLGVFVYDPVAQVTVAGGYFLGNHAALSAHLPAGNYEMSVEAYDNGDIAASIPYVVQITQDAPTVRCGAMTGTPDYVEAHDGASNNANDMVDIDYTTWPPRSMATTSVAPEPTGIAVSNTSSYLLTGAAATTSQVGSYFDHDTFTFTAGATTNQVAVRLSWLSTTTDFDLYVLADGTTTKLSSSTGANPGTDEFLTLALQPGGSYWIWAGASAASQNPDAAYSITICGETFNP